MGVHEGWECTHTGTHPHKNPTHYPTHQQATDFFLCPSRFEPCGLADLEFAFAGGVCVGHRTGGLGKVPGYYFQEHLDNTIVLASGLEGSMHQAMRASWEEVHTLAEEAARKEFPPEEQVARYNAVWDEIHFAWKKTNAHKLALRQPMPNERNFFESMWRIDNLPGARKTEFTNTSAHRMATNILLILMQVCGVGWVGWVFGGRGCFVGVCVCTAHHATTIVYLVGVGATHTTHTHPYTHKHIGLFPAAVIHRVAALPRVSAACSCSYHY